MQVLLCVDDALRLSSSSPRQEEVRRRAHRQLYLVARNMQRAEGGNLVVVSPVRDVWRTVSCVMADPWGGGCNPPGACDVPIHDSTQNSFSKIADAPDNTLPAPRVLSRLRSAVSSSPAWRLPRAAAPHGSVTGDARCDVAPPRAGMAAGAARARRCSHHGTERARRGLSRLASPRGAVSRCARAPPSGRRPPARRDGARGPVRHRSRAAQ